MPAYDSSTIHNGERKSITVDTWGEERFCGYHCYQIGVIHGILTCKLFGYALPWITQRGKKLGIRCTECVKGSRE